MSESLEKIKRVRGDHLTREDGTAAIAVTEFKWLIQQAELAREWELVANDRFRDWHKADNLNQRYKQALEDIRDITTGSAHAFAVKALEESQ